jgi:integrase
MIKVPPNYKRTGIRLWCLKCRAEVTKTCHQKGKSVSTCENKDKHRFKLLVHIPNTSNGRRSRLVKADNFNSALLELTKFKEELQTFGFSQNPVQREKSSKVLLIDLAAEYLDALSGINTPLHLIRKRDPNHVKEVSRTIERFCTALKIAKYNIETLDLRFIGQTEVGIFCDYIVNTLKIRSYNKGCVVMKTFYNWCIDVKDCDFKNPFKKLRLRITPKKDKTAITQEEFKKLLEAVTYENGFGFVGKNKKINFYHDWLPIAYRLALETGLRGEEIVTLKFNNLVELSKGVLVFKIVNLKVWRIQTNEDPNQMDSYVKYVPITASLMKLLMDCGYETHKGTERLVIPIPPEFKMSYAKDLISRSFSHFIKQATDRKIVYKDLRKTYITHLTMALGDKTKLFTGHSNDAIIQNNYLSEAVLVGGLNNISIFGNEV